VTVYYDAPSLNLPGGSEIGKQMFLQTNTSVVAGNPKERISRTLTLVGGVGPYAVSWAWGDDKTTLMSLTGEGNFTATHEYERPGTYRVVVSVTDASGNTAYLQLITVVNGPAEALGGSKGEGSGSIGGSLMAAWPLLILALLMVIFFWLGERRELHKLRSRHLLGAGA
jgi:hypothetical protein